MEWWCLCRTDPLPQIQHHGFLMGGFNFPVNSPALAVDSIVPQGQPQPQAQPQPDEALQEVEHVRNVFPETWLWANASVRYEPCHSDHRISFLVVGSVNWLL